MTIRKCCGVAKMIFKLPTHDVEMMIVDGFFGSSVAFLLIKGIATMFMPL